MKYIVKEAGKKAKTVDGVIDLQTLQGYVDGLIEPVYIKGFVWYVNDEGKLKGMPPNVVLVYNGLMRDTLNGNIVITKDDGAGGDTDISDKEAKDILAMLNDPDMYVMQEGADGFDVLPCVELD